MPFLRSFFLSIARVGGVTSLALVVLLLTLQDRLIYHPRPYAAVELLQSSQRVVDFPFSTSQGLQHCYFVPARAQAAQKIPERVWVVFSGNGSRALDWLSFVQSYPSENDAFLLVDYPGYGACVGSASPGTIRESGDAALACLAASMGSSVGALESRLGVLGHSLGAASALAFASKHAVSRVVLVAPFTSLRDMAQRTVGWPLCYLLRGNFDNRERLSEITQRHAVPRINILFGTEDEVIPFTMGQELARLYPQVHFELVQGAGHNTIISDAADRIQAAMLVP